jgi:hypothetical protein
VFLIRLLDQRVSRCPVAVTIQNRANNPAIQHSLERVVLRSWLPLGHYDISFYPALEMESVPVRRPAAEADTLGSESVLETFQSGENFSEAVFMRETGFWMGILPLTASF